MIYITLWFLGIPSHRMKHLYSHNSHDNTCHCTRSAGSLFSTSYTAPQYVPSQWFGEKTFRTYARKARYYTDPAITSFEYYGTPLRRALEIAVPAGVALQKLKSDYDSYQAIVPAQPQKPRGQKPRGQQAQEDISYRDANTNRLPTDIESVIEERTKLTVELADLDERINTLEINEELSTVKLPEINLSNYESVDPNNRPPLGFLEQSTAIAADLIAKVKRGVKRAAISPAYSVGFPAEWLNNYKKYLYKSGIVSAINGGYYIPNVIMGFVRSSIRDKDKNTAELNKSIARRKAIIDKLKSLSE